MDVERLYHVQMILCYAYIPSKMKATTKQLSLNLNSHCMKRGFKEYNKTGHINNHRTKTTYLFFVITFYVLKVAFGKDALLRQEYDAGNQKQRSIKCVKNFYEHLVVSVSKMCFGLIR